MLPYLFILLAIAVRFLPFAGPFNILPHAWHFTPLAASLLFFGARGSKRQMWIPLVLLAATDVVLTKFIYSYTFSWDHLVTWAWYAAILWLGTNLREKSGPVRVVAAALAERNGVRITTTVRDLERREVDLPVERYALVTVFRFLHRPLFPRIERAIAPGGWLVYETFRRGQERFGRPTHPRFLLDDGELSSAFPRLTVEHYEEPRPEDGPITARLLARKPPH